eukprot:PhF_6_TR22352/c0_g1_i1/m.31659
MSIYAGILLAVTLITLGGVEAGNFSLSVSKDDRRVIDLGTFGFASTGVFELKITKFDLEQKEELTTIKEKIGFTLDLVTSAQYARQEKNYGKTEEAENRVCFVDDSAVKPSEENGRYLFPLEKPLADGKILATFGPVYVTTPGLYALFFYNCKKYGENTGKKPLPVHVTFEVSVSEFNVFEDTRDYLSIGKSNLPTLYVLFTLLYIGLFITWCRAIGQNGPFVHKIHFLMGFLLLIKALSLLLDAAKYYTHKKSGVASMWDVLYYVVLTFKGITLFTVILLLGSGWSFLRPFVPDREKKLLLALLPLQVLINISIAVIEETSEGDASWSSWCDTLRVVDIACCCAVLLPVVWSLKTMKDASNASGKVARARIMLRQFRTFYIFVVCFIYYTRIVVVLIENALPYRNEWMADFFKEAGIVLFYTFTGIRFQPMEKNPYLQLNDEDLTDVRVREEIADNAANHGPEMTVAKEVVVIDRERPDKTAAEKQ